MLSVRIFPMSKSDLKINNPEKFRAAAKDVLEGTGRETRELQDKCFGLYLYLESLAGKDLRYVSDPKTTFGGSALAPTGAAMCVLGRERTHVFLKGLVSAINRAKEVFTERPIRILYAGCGPFALLANLAAPFFEDGEVEFTAMDIYQVSVDCARKVSDCLGQTKKFGQFLCADATTYQHTGLKPHIIITETMKTMLQEEPQVAITANLGDQLEPGGFFLPEEVRISAYIESKFGRLEALGEIFTLTREISRAVKQNGVVNPEMLSRVLRVRKRLKAPRQLNTEIDRILIQTSIKVFGDVVLRPSDDFQLTEIRRYAIDGYGSTDHVYIDFDMGNKWQQGVREIRF